MRKEYITKDNLKPDLEVVCYSSTGKFKAWTGKVELLYYKKMGEDVVGANVIPTSQEKPEVVKAEDLCPACMFPDGFLGMLKEKGLLSDKPYDPIGASIKTPDFRDPSHFPAAPAGTSPAPPAAKIEPLYIEADVTVPPGAEVEWSRAIGGPFHDDERNVIGEVVLAGNGKVTVRVKLERCDEIRQSIESGQEKRFRIVKEPGADISQNPAVAQMIKNQMEQDEAAKKLEQEIKGK